ncbi:hypothetical protein NQ318_007379 [Aromia moschata]|uniref:SKI/SNO/DAC domain-containing protein n=1 Tax=Aromia moschata TaxID=1265417 RepID=A0AAV8YF77_9CUCU|nr:hypothetical protein NQ318_007379 [Aromia moschata]
MMDNPGMDSASDHSSHASSGSPAVAIKPSPSPPNNNNISSNNHNHNQVHSPRQASPLGPPMSMAHPLSPPPVSSASLARSMALGHLPPPGLGLLNSLGKVAAFIIAGDTMLCLPQAFELFLKHLVGGLHTVYTKLKRLDIVPLVCNVEQVRILRGLGAIQPGVNRCKLLSCKDFDTLYKDCTTASGGVKLKTTTEKGRQLAEIHTVGGVCVGIQMGTAETVIVEEIYLAESTGWHRIRTRFPARPSGVVPRESPRGGVSLSVEWDLVSSRSQTSCVQLSNSFLFPDAECFPTVYFGLHSRLARAPDWM